MTNIVRPSWLNEEISNRLTKIRNHVSSKWKGKPPLKWFTPHGEEHSKAVEDQIHQLIPSEKYELLNETERFVLLASAWLHDIGMIPDLFGNKTTDEIVRDTHHERTSRYIQDFHEELGLNIQESIILSEICIYHRKKENINKCPSSLYVGTELVRVQLLASYLRLADALHIDVTRTDEYLYKIYLMTNIPREEKFHWVKSHSISAIVASADKMNIIVKMRIPQDWETDRVKPLLEIITEDIQEELDSIKNILIRGQVSMFLEVIPNIETAKALTADQYQIKDLDDLLRNIELLRSPNASKIIDVVLDNIVTMCNLREKEATQRLIEYEKTLLDNVLIQKSCHAGLRKIIHILNTRLIPARKENIDITEIEQVKKDIKNEVQRIKRDRKEAKKNIQEHAKSLLLDGGPILLFGYSDSVLSALDGLPTSVKEKTIIYICECRNKTRYDYENKLVYCDAIHYAHDVHKLGYKNIIIISDCTVSNLMSRGKIDKVLLGANGIDKEYMVGHTVGHLAVADLAKVYGVPVYIIVEFLKFGDFEHKPHLERDNEWLTSMNQPKELLSEAKIQILNLREDIVPPDKISMFITDMGIFHSQFIKNIKR